MLSELLSAAVSLPWSSDSDGEGLWLLGPGAGIAFYMYHYLRYRNTNKRHAFEHETASQIGNTTGDEALVGRVTGVENARVPGHNSNSPRHRLGQASQFIEE